MSERGRERERDSHCFYITQVFELTVAVQEVLMNSNEIYKNNILKVITINEAICYLSLSFMFTFMDENLAINQHRG